MLSLRPSLKLALSQSRFFSSTTARKTGVVRSFDRTKGYGFINTSEPGDIFVHWKQIQSDGFSSLVGTFCMLLTLLYRGVPSFDVLFLTVGETVEFTSALDSKNRTVANEVSGKMHLLTISTVVLFGCICSKLLLLMQLLEEENSVLPVCLAIKRNLTSLERPSHIVVISNR